MVRRFFLDGRAWALFALLVTAFGLIFYALPDQVGPSFEGGLDEVRFDVLRDSAGTAHLIIRSVEGGRLRISENIEGPLDPLSVDRVILPVRGNVLRTEHLVSIPSGLKWRRPFLGQPSAMVVRATAMDELGRKGAVRFHTVPTVDHGELPVLSILVPEGALFDPDTGIYVVGNAILYGVHAQGIEYKSDPRWWKYPGNYHGRGKEWERRANMQMIAPDGTEMFQEAVRLRINGQLTRAFPQHALRVLFDEPLSAQLFDSRDDVGLRAMVVRSAGNDQVKAFMRDAVLQRACSGGLVEVADARTCVVYINGAYWGLHHIRHRMDEREIARRHGIAAKEVAFVEVIDGNLMGEWEHIKTLKRLATTARNLNEEDSEFLASMGQVVDIDAFLEYMAIMLYVDNRDWPRTNTKFWRRTGKAAKEQDGLWRPILQDLDLSFGANAPPTADPWEQARDLGSPFTHLLRALLYSPEWRARFHVVLRELLAGRLATTNVLAEVDAMVALLEPEMERHIARWRKPESFQLWTGEVEVMRKYARHRQVTMERMLIERTSLLH